MVTDVSVFLLSLYACIWIFDFSTDMLPDDQPGNQFNLNNLAALFSFSLIWHTVFRYVGLYQRRATSFLRPKQYRLYDILKATSFGSLLFIGIAFLTNAHELGLQHIVAFWFFTTLGTVICHEIMNIFLREIRLQGHNLRHLLIVGTNDRAQEIARRIIIEPEHRNSYKVFVDDKWLGSTMDYQEGSIVSNLADFNQYLKSNVIDEIIIALPIATLYTEASRIVNLCEKQGVVVHFVPGFDFLNIGSSMLTINSLGIEPIITIIQPPMSGWRLATKRFIDLSISTILIVILSPVFLMTALLVKLSSPGPVLFIQERIGLNKRKFPLLKFRTMVTNAEEIQASLENQNEADGPVFKIDNDPRITPYGDFLRRASLDELPQLFNVLAGHMSLVGPRPLPMRDYIGFSEDWHRRRFSVRPGITCIWQISGRSSITFDRWMEMDMEYIKHWTLWLDFKILLGTLSAVMKQRGAY
jgi:exopolysaccharide biosynthesis polyprenyl glycosylphosphotransferase